MWVSSSVVTLPENREQAAAIVESIKAIPAFEIGLAAGRELPVVIEAEDGSAARHWHHWLEDLPGVVHVDIAFVSFDDDTEDGETDASATQATREDTSQPWT